MSIPMKGRPERPGCCIKCLFHEMDSTCRKYPPALRPVNVQGSIVPGRPWDWPTVPNDGYCSKYKGHGVPAP